VLALCGSNRSILILLFLHLQITIALNIFNLSSFLKPSRDNCQKATTKSAEPPNQPRNQNGSNYQNESVAASVVDSLHIANVNTKIVEEEECRNSIVSQPNSAS